MTPADAILASLAEALGVTISYGRLTEDRDGEYHHAKRLIRLRPGMHRRLHRSVLAHELGHAAFGDTPSPSAVVDAKQERRAEEWAALQLIDADEYRQSDLLHRGHAGAIALELGVMTSTVRAFQGMLARHGDAVYVAPRLGQGQWARRLEAA